jgi:hypothetical protein
MSTLSKKDIVHLFEALRSGKVPERGVDAIAVGVEKQRGELHRQLEMVESGEGTIKFLRGGYGCGKTFMARLLLLDAQSRGRASESHGGAAEPREFATSFVVVSENNLQFHRFEDVYRRIMSELSTSACPRGALGDILDRWIGRIEASLISLGVDPDAAGFDAQVRARLEGDLASMTGGKASPDFVRVVQTIFDLQQKGEVVEAGALISWLSGSENVAAAAKKRAGIKGDIGSRDALDYLRGVLEIIKAAGYAGLVVVIDEAETILRTRKDLRHKSLNGIRQIADAAGSYPGLLWVMTGTREFFDSRQGVAGLAPLHDRIRFLNQGRFVSMRQPQLELSPFDAERLRGVALRLRELYPTHDRARLEQRIGIGFIERLVAEVQRGFKADVGVVPRQFLREFVNQLDLVEENRDYDPLVEYGFVVDVASLHPEEQRALEGDPLPAGDDSELVPAEEVW